MDDKEVGELWRECLMLPGNMIETHSTPRLIRKLVEERVNVYRWGYREGYREYAYETAEQDILRDVLVSFGIDPKDWK